MAEGRKVIITCAVTGCDPHAVDVAAPAGHAGARSPRPRSARRRPGAAIVHLHARDPVDGRPDAGSRGLPRVPADDQAALRRRDQHHHRRRPDDDDRGAAAAGAAAQARGRLAQHGLDELRPLPDAPALQGVQARLGAALPRRLATTRIFKNTFKDIDYILTSCADNGTRFEFECYDIGHLYTAPHFLDRGLVKPPLFIQSVFGILGGIGPHPEDVLHMKRTADRLFGDQLPVVRARRGPQPDARRRDVGRDGRQRARRARGQPVARPGPARAESNAAQVQARARRSSRGSDSRSRRRTTRGAILQLKGGSDVGF